MSELLFLTQVLPYPLDAGPKVRGYYMLRHLSRRHEVTLVSFVRPDDRPEYVAHLAGIARAVHTVPIRRSPGRNAWAAVRGLLTGRPIVIARDEMPEMAALLRRLTAETRFAAIHADQLSMAGWGLMAARLAAASPCHPATVSPCHPATLLDAHNAIYRLTERMAAEATGWRRLLMRREAAAFRRYEAAMLRAYDAVLTVTEEDRELLAALLATGDRSQGAGVRRQESGGRNQPPAYSFQPPTSNLQFPGAKFTVVPICVDPDSIRPIWEQQGRTMPGNKAAPEPSPCHPVTVSPRPPTILHLGTMFWPPNVAGVLWFARAALPLVWRDVPDARFVIVGKNPPAAVRALAANPRIVVTGYVADPQPYLEAAAAFIVPLFSGSGMRVKILDAWLWGLPVVATPLGAEGIAAQDGENILLAADAAAFAAATRRLLTDPALNAHLRAAGRAWVEQTYSWQVVYRKVDDVYARLLAGE